MKSVVELRRRAFFRKDCLRWLRTKLEVDPSARPRLEIINRQFHTITLWNVTRNGGSRCTD